MPTLTLLILACSSEPVPSQAPPETPAMQPAPQGPAGPVLLVTLDTTRADRLGCYGHDKAHTPNLDGLARAGLLFERAISPVPLTIPSHSTLFTGLYPPHHGVQDNGDQRLSPEAHTLAELVSEAGGHTEAVVGAYVTQSHWGFAQGFARYDEDLGVPSDRLGWRVERPANEVVDAALAALERDPALLWVHLFDAHTPYAPPAPWSETMPDAYDGELAFIDEQLGRLFEGVSEDTWIIVVGDHGESMGEGGEGEHGMLLTEGALHVPLLIAGPGVAAGVVEEPVSLTDLLPTVLGLMGLEQPTDLDGVDLLSPYTREGVLSGAWYGQHHYGWAALHAVTTATGRMVRGTRDEITGEVSPAALALLEQATTWTPAWDEAPLTLDQTQLVQLQALGYLAAPAAQDQAADGSVDPRDGLVRLQALREHMAEDPAKLEARLREVLVEMPGMRDLRLRLATLLARQGKTELALAEIATAHLGNPSSTTAMIAGDLWLQRENPAEALGWFQEALMLDPRAAQAYAGIVTSFAGMRRLDLARHAAEQGLLLSPDDPRLLIAAAELALASGDPVDPSWAKRIEELVQARPWLPRVHLIAASLAQQSGNPETAEQHLREELRWRPLSAETRMQLVLLLREQGRHLQVVKTLRPLVNVDGDQPLWHAETARAYLAMDRLDLAAPHIDRCAGHPSCPSAP